MDSIDVAVIGAGAIGLAIARLAAQRGHEVLVIDKNGQPGMGISSRNSEVIHAGVYYPKGSLKAQHCVNGKRMIYDYCAKLGVPYKKTGKLIVATTAREDTKLEDIALHAEANGLVGEEALRHLSSCEVAALEPDLACTSALLSPSTGIIDSHQFIQQLVLDAGANGSEFSFGTLVEAIEPGTPHRLIGTSQGEKFDITVRHLFITAGLHTTSLARSANVPSPSDYWLKGNYFVLNQQGPFSRLIYPVPVEGGLGVHVTLDMGGGTRFGPDTQSISDEDYYVDPARGADFEKAIRRYWPGLPNNALQPGYSGIRPKLKAASGRAADFVIDGPEQTNYDGLVVLHGIESPGLTSSLSLAEASCNAMFKGQ